MKYVHKKGPSLYYVRYGKWTWLCSADSTEEQIKGSIWKIQTAGSHNLETVIQDYIQHRLPRLASATQKNYRNIIKSRLIPLFGSMRPDDLTSQEVAMYLERRERQGHGPAGNKEIAVLSSVFNHGMRIGRAKTNPTYGVRRNTEHARTFYIEDGSLRLGLRNAPSGLRHLLWGGYLTGYRQKDLINIKKSDVTPAGLRVRQSKDGKFVLILWTDSLRKLVRKAMCRSKCQYVLTNQYGQKLTNTAIETAMRRMKAKTGVKWTFHDIRAKADSDHKTGLGLMRRYNRAQKFTAVK